MSMNFFEMLCMRLSFPGSSLLTLCLIDERGPMCEIFDARPELCFHVGLERLVDY